MKIPGSFLPALVFFFSMIYDSSMAQKFDKQRLDDLASSRSRESINMLREILSIPNDASFPQHVALNVEYCQKEFADRGFQLRLLETGGPPALLAQRLVRRPVRTLLVYLQIDGQPVDSSEWHQDSPYVPVLKKIGGQGGWDQISWDLIDEGIDPEWRVFARSASDAKGPVVMFLTAIDIIDELKFEPNYNIKVIMDFEEELGSPHLPAAVIRYRDVLAADWLIILDGPRHITNRPTLTFGARGITTVTLTTFGPRVPQHSGHYGNYAPNPAFALSKILASLKDNQGRVTLQGFYDGVSIDDQARAEMESVPDDEEEIKRNIGIAESDKVGNTYQESIQYPSLNIRGLRSAWVGDQVRTIIPSTAIAEIDIRLVPESDTEKLVGLLRQHIEKMGYYFVDGQPTEEERLRYPKLISMTFEHSYNAFRTPVNSDVGIWLSSAINRGFGSDPIKKRISGGSIPISPFVTTLNVPAVTVPTVNPDNNQHSPNENIRLGNLHEGVITVLSILTEKMK